MRLSNGFQFQQGNAKRIGLIVLALVIILPLLYTWTMLSWSYSTGERAGWLQKLSHKGVICKTDEGELSLIAVPGAAPEKFFFTVRDKEVAKKVQELMGHRVSLHYEQKVGLPTSCFGDTSYFVTGIEEVNEATMPAWTTSPAAPASTPAPAPAPAAVPAAPQ
ncbi:MAG: hypothetical protein V4607_14750 [Pseudomonadota bacterium]